MKSLIRNFITLVTWVFVMGGCYSPPTDIPPGNRKVEFYKDQYLRTTNFYIPKRLKKRRRSIVFCLHGEEESAASMVRITRRGFNDMADQHGFIVGYPEALNEYWNDGREDSISLSHYNQIDDVGFIDQLITYSIDSFRVDPDQVFVAGLSNGGFMTYRIACELSERVKGVAAVSASMALDQLVTCSADTTVSLMVINGTRDPLMPYDGGEMIVDEISQGSVLSAEATIQYWLEDNQCKDKFSKRDVPNSNLFDETRSERFVYANCENGAKVALITVTNGGHTWPGGRQYEGQRNIGRTSRDFDAAVEIWRFFRGL